MKAEELIGKKITGLFIKTIASDKNDCAVEQIYLELENIGIVTIPDMEHDSAVIIDNGLKLHQDNFKVAGNKIEDILISEMLPFYNVSLSNGLLIFCDSTAPDQFKWYVDCFSEKYKNQYDYSSLKGS